MLSALLVLALAAAAADRPKRPVEMEALIDAARAAPAEFSSDVLLRIAGSTQVSERAWKRELIEEAFLAAGRAQWPYRRLGGRHTDTRESRAAWDNGLDGLSLQTRAVDAMLSLDARRALEMFHGISLAGVADPSCGDALFHDVSAYYASVPKLFEKTFTAQQRRAEEDIAFIEGVLRNLRSAVQAAPAGGMVFRLQLPKERRQRLVNAFAGALESLPANQRVFDLNNGLAGVGFASHEAGLDMGIVMPALRSYAVRNLRAASCGAPKRAGTSMADELNALIRKLNATGADYEPIAEEQREASGNGGAYQVNEYWQSARSKQVIGELQWLNHGNRMELGDERFWTLAERSTQEWNGRYLDLLKLIEGWREHEEAAPSDFFHMKASALALLARLVPPGAARDNALRSFLSFLEESYPGMENRNEWFTELQLLRRPGGSPEDRAWFLDEMARSKNAVISLYARVERLLGGNR